MSFGESMFLAGFNQKTAKEDLFTKGNYGIPPRKDSRRLQRVNHQSEGQATDMWGQPAPHAGCPALVGPTCQPPCYIGSPPP
jgi:hypothetical protein